MLTLRAYAKINLGLEVTGRRADGYHDLVSLMQTVDLYDTLAVDAAPDAGGEWIFTCSDASLGGDDNLVLKACRRMQQRYGVAGGGRISLTKRIPAAGGLGGGSSDAAAMLVAFNRLYDLHLTREALMAEAATIGSDVPFFLSGGTALVEGRGERVTHTAPEDATALYATTVLLVAPPVTTPPNKTAALYAALDPVRDFSDGTQTRALVAGLRAGGPLDTARLVNAFARPLAALMPGLPPYIQLLRDAGVAQVCVSGSGPTLYGLFARRAEAEEVYARVVGLLHTTAAVDPATPAHLLRPVQTEWAATVG